METNNPTEFEEQIQPRVYDTFKNKLSNQKL